MAVLMKMNLPWRNFRKDDSDDAKFFTVMNCTQVQEKSGFIVKYFSRGAISSAMVLPPVASLLFVNYAPNVRSTL